MTRLVTLLAATLLAASAFAQPTFRGTDIFPPEEFAVRRAKLMDKIGDSVAIVLGTTEPPGEMPFRQNSQFFYLTGITEPRARVIIDGRAHKTTVFLQPLTEREERSKYGPGMNPGPEAAKQLGVDAAVPAADFTDAVKALAAEHRVIYTPFAAEVLGSQSQGDPTHYWTNNTKDPWDGRDSRESAFIHHLKDTAPQSEIHDLDPIVNVLRMFKSPREIALIREATRIAGLGIIEAMRDARPGMHEYELQADAEYVFKKNGALGAAYFALIATGQNSYYTHYYRNTAVLKEGDLVQFDYAPDYKYYQSDVTRVFPANGKFSSRQREAYDIYLQLYRALETSIKVHATVADVLKTAIGKMETVMQSYKFTDPKIKAAAENFVDDFRKHSATAKWLGHPVGMEVHDVGDNTGTVLEPGYIFTIEPQMRFEDEHTGIRLEDMILITESGYEVLSRFVPIEMKVIEKAMTRHGLSDAAVKLGR
jgi:Xaa-Pro aminopeptidase